MDEQTRILIVDDNTSLGRTMSLVLERKGYSVMVAGDGLEALEKAREEPFDIVFMDIKMPLMNGVETYKELRRIRPEAAVMMMTAYSVEELIEEALQEGAHGVVRKPLDIDKVVTIIEEATQSKNGALILVVDDDEETRTSFSNILVKKGFSVGTAATGEEAIGLAQHQNHDIIFIDMRLPTINGLETYMRIRSFDPHAVAIMVTGYRQEMDTLVQEALHNNAYACLYKPLDMANVLGLVQEILKRRQPI
jgi:two-component system, NtrC family, response regulator HydG